MHRIREQAGLIMLVNQETRVNYIRSVIVCAFTIILVGCAIWAMLRKDI
jgi:cbb3-type cytochrome oxidase subunit 3